MQGCFTIFTFSALYVIFPLWYPFLINIQPVQPLCPLLSKPSLASFCSMQFFSVLLPLYALSPPYFPSPLFHSMASLFCPPSIPCPFYSGLLPSHILIVPFLSVPSQFCSFRALSVLFLSAPSQSFSFPCPLSLVPFRALSVPFLSINSQNRSFLCPLSPSPFCALSVPFHSVPSQSQPFPCPLSLIPFCALSVLFPFYVISVPLPTHVLPVPLSVLLSISLPVPTPVLSAVRV